ncbi:TylF/MycF family methyltransferase [Paenibacillus sp. MER TA 81-3]|uniref:TylF/MycF/NovP-related O-methyltransferase n=1 Tax=Paenibacillus sp. MER TA 81-3 TaxID=2939573 RepID=UPI00203D9DCB|nr:TylF/MycF/NovP-related O-methyltransferase [Paenibacillus sp. MER TA 81-3]MCM3338746.1 TylF/MycF family methyltransferase [Paenibacillus sp. MER TA 81-3]
MFEKVKVMIFGTGEGARRALAILDLDKVEILCYIDNDSSKQNTLYNGIKVISPEEVKHNYDFIVIASMFFEEIFSQLIELGVEKGKIIKIFKEKTSTSKEMVKQLFEENKVYTQLIKKSCLEHYYNNYAVCDMIILEKDRNELLYNFPDFVIKGLDYVRVSTLELISREIYSNNIEGAVAELGVYKGDFSKIINHLFKDRRLFLFDTFEGFSQRDVNFEKNHQLSNIKVGHLCDTTINTVLLKMNNPENCIVKKGYFPESAQDINNEKFAFVSIDTDLYTPTLEGLKFFYPRLEKGGYILIHDYNHVKYKGVKKAVKEFCKEEGLNYVPLSDYFGSVVIAK